MESCALNQRMDLEKLQYCPNGCGNKAKYYCTEPEPCNEFRYFCESCAQKEANEGGHPHKVTSIIKVIREHIVIEDAVKNQIENLYQKICEKQDEHSKLIEMLEKGTSINSEKLSNKIQILRKLKDDFDRYFFELDNLCVEYKATEIIYKIKSEGVELKKIYLELSTLKQLDQDLIWKYYSDAIKSGFSDSALLSEFTEQNWNMYHNLCRIAQNEKIEQLGKETIAVDRIAQLEDKLDQIIQENESNKKENSELKQTVSLLQHQIDLLNGTLSQIKMQLQERGSTRKSKESKRQNETSSHVET